MKVSVIMPAYNVEQYIYDTVRSVLNQTLSDFELIIVDDGSTDSTVDIIKSIMVTDDRIRLFETLHEGVSSAKNFGFRQASGNYFYFLDSDDLIDCNALEFLYDLAESHQLDLICGSFSLFKDQQPADFDLNHPLNHPESAKSTNVITGLEFFNMTAYKRRWSERKVNNWLYLFKKEYWLSNNLEYLKGRYYEDLELFPKFILPAVRMISTDFKFYHYRQRQSSIMSEHLKIERFDDYFNAIVSIDRTFSAFDLPAYIIPAYSRMLATEYIQLLRLVKRTVPPARRNHYLEQLEWARVMRYLRKSKKKSYIALSLLPGLTARHLVSLLSLRSGKRKNTSDGKGLLL